MLERVEEEPRAVFLHLFRVGHFLSFSAFSGWLLELFTVPFRRVQRFYARGDHGRNRNNHLWVKNKAIFLLSVTVRLLPFKNRMPLCPPSILFFKLSLPTLFCSGA